MAMETLRERIGMRLPIIQAPMAGGPDTPALAAAVSDAGGLGSLGCAYLSAAQIDALVAAVRARTKGPFALNLFVRDEAPRRRRGGGARGADPRRAAARARAAAGGAGARKPAPSDPEQLAAVIRARPRLYSFTFGAPTAAAVAELRAAGIVVVGTATSLDEAEALAALGVDAICAQGTEAGGHRGTFVGRFEEALVGTLALMPQLVARVPLPIVAAGGIMDGAGIRAALALGAAAVQLGTAFLLCPEAGTHRGASRGAALAGGAHDGSDARLQRAGRRAGFAIASPTRSTTRRRRRSRSSRS